MHFANGSAHLGARCRSSTYPSARRICGPFDLAIACEFNQPQRTQGKLAASSGTKEQKMRGGPISRILSKGRKDPRDDHSSWPQIALTPLAANPNLLGPRGPAELPRRAVPIWHCSQLGLPCPPCYQRGGGLLLHRFTLTRARSGGLFSVALSVGLLRPGVTRHRFLVESGLSSARLARKILGPWVWRTI